MNSVSYQIIKGHYGDRVAERSQVPLMNHIDEGLVILGKLGASEHTKDAYCLHPIFQSSDDFRKHRKGEYEGVPAQVIILAMEYRRVANSYLSKGKRSRVSSFLGFSCPEIKQMLIADKVQNYRDFMEHHHGVHGKSDELQEYFTNWFKLLAIGYEKWKDVILIQTIKK